MPGAPKAEQTSIVTLSLKAKKDEELRVVDYDFRERSPEERTPAPQGFLTALMSREQVAERIGVVDAAGSFFELLEVLVSGPTDEEFAALSLRRVTADLTYGTPADAVAPETESLVFAGGQTGDKTWFVKRRGRASLACTLELTYEFGRDGTVDGDSLTYRAGPREHTGRALSIRPYDDVAVLAVEVGRGRLPDSVRDVDVALDYADAASGFTAHQQLRLPPGEPQPLAQRRWQVRSRSAQDLSYTMTATLVFDDATVLALPPQRTAESLVRVNGRFRGTRMLLVQPNVTSPELTSIVVDVAYDDPGAGYFRRFQRMLTATAPVPADGQAPPPPAWQPVTLSWPILDAARQRALRADDHRRRARRHQ